MIYLCYTAPLRAAGVDFKIFFIRLGQAMKKADTTIEYVQPGSFAEEAGLAHGDILLSVNGHEFHDVLEYRYLISESAVELEVKKLNGDTEIIYIENDFEDLGIEFKSGLIDDAKSCRNKCIFCFIDQLPKGMRETVYFKDDDTRLSFLQGNYVTLTNMSDEEIERMIKMRISPINLSVHTTNPELRKKMLNNKNAGKIYEIMKRFSAEGLCMNCQIVLCPGYNDGAELDRTISDLAALYPSVLSLSVVPVGLTRYRDGLCPLTGFNKESSAKVIEQVHKWQDLINKKYGFKMVYLSDEFYIMANCSIPPAEDYEGFPQIENGVGLVASLTEEFDSAIKLVKKKKYSRSVTIATGELAYQTIKGLAERLEKTCDGLTVNVYAIKNNFFGGMVNVAGLVCGNDLITQLADKPKTDITAIPSVMLRDSEDIFLDDVTLTEAEERLGCKIIPVNNDGYEFVEAITGEELF